jgi:hypothetical protein
MSKATTFEVEIAPQLANTGTLELVVRESLDALIGFEASVLVEQKNDRTLQVTIIEKPRLS